MTNRFVIIDDDKSIVKILNTIITNNLGKVVGELNSGLHAVEEILFYNPDILLIDYLLPDKDGVQIVKEVKEKGFTGKIIMISQVEDQEMVSRAYNEGVLFFITKPINFIEVINVIKNVSKNIELENSMTLIKSALNITGNNMNIPVRRNIANEIEEILADLGIIGDSGAQVLIQLIEKVIEYKMVNNHFDYKLQDIYLEVIEQSDDNKTINIKTLEQRIRRLIIKALSNLSQMGVDDYYNPKFIEYSSLLFDFKQIRQEMSYIENPKNDRGKINIKKFIEGIISKIKL